MEESSPSFTRPLEEEVLDEEQREDAGFLATEKSPARCVDQPAYQCQANEEAQGSRHERRDRGDQESKDDRHLLNAAS